MPRETLFTFVPLENGRRRVARLYFRGDKPDYVQMSETDPQQPRSEELPAIIHADEIDNYLQSSRRFKWLGVGIEALGVFLRAEGSDIAGQEVKEFIYERTSLKKKKILMGVGIGLVGHGLTKWGRRISAINGEEETLLKTLQQESQTPN